VFILLLLLCDLRSNTDIVYVDIMELNHLYNKDCSVVMDQVILWEWRSWSGGIERWPIRSFPLRDCREDMSPEEYDRRNIKFQQDWDKKWGANTFRPKYVRRFVHDERCPQYDHRRKVWYCIFLGKMVYSKTYMETWTQEDPELTKREAWEEIMLK
jgi:hypothetical protein